MKALLVILIACDAAKPAPPAPPAPRPIADAAIAIDAPLALPSDARAEARLLRGNTKRWKHDVVAFAQATSRYVGGWGTVKLDGENPIRFATIVPDGMGERGAYLLELAPHHIVAVGFYYDGRTSAFGDERTGIDPRDDLEFREHDETSISHGTGHHHGGESLRFGLRDHELVLFEYSYTDDVTDDTEKPIENKFPDDFACRPRCPDLARFRYYLGSQLSVSTAARTIAELVEPAPTPYGPASAE